jgi:magnesium-transporting ATPase (P-type)
MLRRYLQSSRSINSTVAFPRWLVIREFCDWLSRTNLSVAFQSANWFVPTVQTVHIISIAILLTSVYVVSFRLIGVTRGGQPLAVVIAKSTPWVWTTLCVLLGTGILLTVTEPARELLNWAFRVKMLMVIGLAGILLLVQIRARHSPQYWTASPSRRLAARAIGIAAVIIGAGIVTAGRWIAYV